MNECLTYSVLPTGSLLWTAKGCWRPNLYPRPTTKDATLKGGGAPAGWRHALFTSCQHDGLAASATFACVGLRTKGYQNTNINDDDDDDDDPVASK